jgi:hypothetical protein
MKTFLEMLAAIFFFIIVGEPNPMVRLFGLMFGIALLIYVL